MSKHLIRHTVREIIDLSAKSAILADPKSKQFCKQYSELTVGDANTPEESTKLLKFLCKEHGIKNEALNKYISILASDSSSELCAKNFKKANFDKLSAKLKPEYYSLFQNLGRVTDGVKTLVKLREDVLGILQQKKHSPTDLDFEEDLKIMNSVLKSLLSLWFSIGLLNVKRIDWNSPASLVEKVAQYESVHKMRTLSDLKGRLSDQRRCFIYTHSTMPYEPLIILHIALTTEVTSNIKNLIKTSATGAKEIIPKEEFTNAIFYSINSCQKGLQQVDLGNALIKSCVRLLLDEMPNLKNFHTLSPIPKFREWIDLKLALASSSENDRTSGEYFVIEEALTSDEVNLLESHFQARDRRDLFEKMRLYLRSNEFRVATLDLDDGHDGLELATVLGRFLRRACAFYLCHEKKNGYAFNPVANFHLKNGAHVYRINYRGDVSDNGWKNSYGFMVNYGYKLDELDANCIKYLVDKEIKVSELIQNDLQLFKKKMISKI